MKSRSLLLTFSLGLLIAALLGLSLGASSAQTQTPTLPPTVTAATLTPTPSVAPAEALIGPREFPEDINPLTGLPFPDEAAKNRRNLILKISNYPEVVRPQFNLSLADLVWEYEVEGGVTRFAAIYRSHAPEMVGPIRSGRLMDIELVNAYQALLGYSGSNEWLYNFILNEADWRWRALSPQLGNNCPMFCRIRWDDRAFEHTLFANTLAIWQEADRIDVNQATTARGLAFRASPDPSDLTANDIAIDWYNDRTDMRWQYNPADQKYYRWESGLPHLDAATGQQLATDNVVLIEVWHQDRPDVYESETGGIALGHLLEGSGTAWVFRDGLWYKGEWYRNPEATGVYIRYLGADAEGNFTPIALKPGQTWIQVVRKQFLGSENELWSVTVSEELVEAQATAQARSAELTAVPAATQTQFAEWYGSPTPSQTWTPTPTGTWQYN
jgi:hypothetical protein